MLEVLTVPFVAKVKEERLNGHFLNPVIDVCRDLQSSTVAPPFFRSSHPGRERHTSSMQIIFRVLNKYFYESNGVLNWALILRINLIAHPEPDSLFHKEVFKGSGLDDLAICDVVFCSGMQSEAMSMGTTS